jgi:subtilisin-like proprotein convertase family protein
VLSADLTTLPRRDTPMEVLEHIGVVDGTSVSIPWLTEGRTATVPDLSMYDRRVAPLIDEAAWTDKTLQVALRIRYLVPALGLKKIAFWGQVHAPDFDYETGKVTINAKDPALRLDKAYSVTGDDLISPGYTLDGRGMAAIIAAGQNRENQDDLGYPSLGLNPGLDLSTRLRTLFRTASRGDKLWTLLTELAQLQIGPDFEFEPFESDPVNLASGPATDNVNHAIPGSATTDYTINVGLPGIIEGFRLGLYVTHAKPSDLDVWLIHPDTTTIQLYDGTRDRNQGSTGGDAFGTSDGTLMFFADFGEPEYGSSLRPSTFPKVGQWTSDDPLLPALMDKVAAGVWTLRIRDRGSSGGTLGAWSLRFQLPDPAFARLNTFDKPPENPAMDASFYDGTGPENAHIKVSPLGESVVNWSRMGSGKGKREVIRHNETSRSVIGNMQNWTTTNEDDSTDVLTALANRELAAYSYAPDALAIKPHDDRGQRGLPRLLFDYKVGGHVIGVAKKGYCRHRVPARVTSGTLRNAGKVVQTDIGVIPVVGAQADLADG